MGIIALIATETDDRIVVRSRLCSGLPSIWPIISCYLVADSYKRTPPGIGWCLHSTHGGPDHGHLD